MLQLFSRRKFATSAASNKKHKVVIIGSGWGGFRLATDLDKKLFEVELISPRNYFLFTPLLPSTLSITIHNNNFY
jgi:NADH dehydrogenase FAD-containing subunit